LVQEPLVVEQLLEPQDQMQLVLEMAEVVDRPPRRQVLVETVSVVAVGVLVDMPAVLVPLVGLAEMDIA